jgi:Zn/Cd-binding protein ZinT
MKQFTILLTSIITIGLSLTSCIKEKNTDSLIEGKWAYSQKGIETSDGEVLSDFEHEKLCNENYVEFFKNGTVNEGKYSHNGNCELEVDSGSWKAQGDDLTINFPTAGEETAKILELDEKTLKVKAKANGVDIIYVYKKV